jgi:acetyl-CoA carboxylase carboxyl transferase subunit beta
MDRHPNQVMRRPNAARPLAAPGPKLRPVAPAGTVECRGCGRRFGEARFEKHLRVCPDCGRHAVVPAMTRVVHLGDAGSIDVVHMEISDRDPLGFNDGVPYPSRVAEARERTRIDETFVVARADVATMPVVLACMDFGFLGGSLGSAAGEQFARACDLAVAEKRSLVAVCTSGGARMQEGIVSLAQMARCSAGVVGVARAGLPYISVLADPCFGGVTASFAVQADVILAEPHARIGFAGGRVIEQATYDRLPEGFQTSEFLLAHGMVDAVLPRAALRDTVARLLVAFSGRR